MNPIMSLVNGYRRLRHSYGFGVHSPAAYKMVRGVLMDVRGCAYYYFDRLDSMSLSAEERRRARILHRLAARYPFSNNMIAPDLPEVWSNALAPAFGKGRARQGSLMVAMTLSDVLPDIGVAAFFNLKPDDFDRLHSMMQYGVLLSGKDAAILIIHPKIHFVEYSVII